MLDSCPRTALSWIDWSGEYRIKLLSSRLCKLVGGATIVLLTAYICVVTLTITQAPRSLQITESSPKGRLHLLVPATSSNADLCKLMLSAQILGYPTPVLINYGDHEDDDAYVQHLGKVEGILSYLNALEASDNFEEDLVLIVDVYDIWFQLRPDLLIKRFYASNAAAQQRLIETYGEELVREQDMRQTVIFGSDKLCWPVGFSRPACWAVPSSTLPSTTFGRGDVRTNRNYNEPRWLNSGTVLGTATDLKEVFRATLEAIRSNHVTNSDQYYFAEIFGHQEYARMSWRPDILEEAKSKEYFDVEDAIGGAAQRTEPDVRNKKPEYHIGLDYSSSLFQSLAYWKQYLAWPRGNDSWLVSDSNLATNNIWDVSVAEDINQSLPPFQTISSDSEDKVQLGWSQVELAYNILTKQHPPLLHITGNPNEKQYRAWWWQKLWFQSRAEELRLASRTVDQRQVSQQTIAGMIWFNAEASDAEEISAAGKGGAWTDRRGWLSWKRLCGAFEDELYHIPGDDFYHPTAPPQDQVN